LAGERADPDTVKWAERILGVPVLDHWWQTETGWAIVGNPVGLGMLPVKYGSPTVAMPGYQIEIIDEAGKRAAPHPMGAIAVKPPLPPRGLPSLLGQGERFIGSYLAGFSRPYQNPDAGVKGD